MKATELRTLIKESIQEYIREVETSGNIAAQEAKIRACEEAIAIREKKINLEGLDETMHEMIDKSKLNELKKEVKELQKYKTKAEGLLEKMKNKAEGKTTKKPMQDENMDEIIDEVSIDETFPESGAQLEEEELTPEESEELRKKAEYYHKEYGIAEAKKKPSAGMTKKAKSALSKKAHAGKDIGKKGKGFEKVAKAGEKQYGSKEAGEKVAAAAMWKAAAKKESVETEGEVLNEQFLHMQKLAGLITETQYKQKMQMLSEESIKSSLKQKEDVVKVLSPLKGTTLNLVGLTEDKKPNGCSATATVSGVTNEYYPQGSNADPDYFEISPVLNFTISNEKLGSDQEANATFKKTLEDIKETPCKISGGGDQKLKVIMDANSGFLNSYEIGATKDSTFFKKLEEILKSDIAWQSKSGDLLALGA